MRLPWRCLAQACSPGLPGTGCPPTRAPGSPCREAPSSRSTEYHGLAPGSGRPAPGPGSHPPAPGRRQHCLGGEGDRAGKGDPDGRRESGEGEVHVRAAPSRASPKAGSRACDRVKRRENCWGEGGGGGRGGSQGRHSPVEPEVVLSVSDEVGAVGQEVSMQLLSRLSTHVLCGGLEEAGWLTAQP